MGKTKKVVENYQIVETLEQYQDDYEILLAKHITEKEYYVMKKLGIKEAGRKALYDGLLNQAAILKLLDHDNIVKCFRMLKTSNNIYIVYTYKEGPTLQQLLDQGPQCLTFSQKEAISKQICLVLTEMQKRSISHLNIIPENIVISGDDSILLKEFIYAMEIPEQGQIAIKRKVPKSEYTAPEVRKGVACFQADIFSFGRILQRLEFRKCKKESLSEADLQKKIVVFENLIEAMLEKKRSERVGLSQIYQTLFSKVRKAKRMKSLSESSMYSSKMSSKSLSASKSRFGSKKAYADIVLKILRQRNLSWLLIKLFARVVEVKLGTQFTTVLSFLLLKKSTKYLANLSKYLHYGRNDINIDITAKQQGKFFKTSDYFKLCELIDKEVQIQKKEFQGAVETIYINNSSLVKIPEINREVKEETVDDEYLSEVITQYLRELLESKETLERLDRVTLADFYLLSQVLVFGKVEDMFRARILLEPVNIDEQIFIQKMKEMEPEMLIQNIRLNCEAKRS